MKTRSSFFIGLFGLFATCAFTTSSQAVLIDWTGKTWSGSPTVFNLDDLSGNTVSVSAVNDGGALSLGVSVNNVLQGGLGAVDESLTVVPTFDNVNDYVTLTFAFSAPVTNLGYTIFDIDSGTTDGFSFFDDSTLISATYLGGSVLASSVNFSNPSIDENASAVTNATGDYSGNAVADNLGVNSGIGNLDVSYSGLVDTIQIRYYAGSGTLGTATTGIGIYNFSGTTSVVAVPEASSILAGTAVLAAVGVGIIRRRKLAAKKSLCPAV